MKLSQRKKELIEELEGILKANKDNPHCDEYWLADMIREALKLYDVLLTNLNSNVITLPLIIYYISSSGSVLHKYKQLYNYESYISSLWI